MIDLTNPAEIASDLKLDDQWYRVTFKRYGNMVVGKAYPMECIKDGDTDNPELAYTADEDDSSRSFLCEYAVALTLYAGEQSEFSESFTIPHERVFTFQQVEHYYCICDAIKRTARALLINAYQTPQDTN